MKRLKPMKRFKYLIHLNAEAHEVYGAVIQFHIQELNRKYKNYYFKF